MSKSYSSSSQLDEKLRHMFQVFFLNKHFKVREPELRDFIALVKQDFIDDGWVKPKAITKEQIYQQSVEETRRYQKWAERASKVE